MFLRNRVVKGDTVKVISGSSKLKVKGHVGIVMAVNRKKKTAQIQGVVMSKHSKSVEKDKKPNIDKIDRFLPLAKLKVVEKEG